MKVRIFLLCLALLVAPPAFSQTPEEAQAAQETYIPNLRLHPATDLNPYGIRIAYVPEDTSPGGGRYFCGALDARQVKLAGDIAVDALKKLPTAAWQNIQMKYLLLCSEAMANGREIGGIPVPPLQLLMLDTGTDPAASPRYPYTILHELYHMIEMQNGSYNDTEWSNRFGGYDNSYAPAAGSTALGSGGTGFINGYGKSFAHEERAEIFAIHVMDPAFLRDFIAHRRDEILQAKLDFIMEKSRTMLGTPLP